MQDISQKHSVSPMLYF